jgi:thiamine biosynthesis lipoprotein
LWSALFLIVSSSFAAPAASGNRLEDTLTRFTYTEYHMGVDARLVVYAPDQKTAEDACAAAFERIAALDSIMSDYRRDSELMRLCAKAGGPPVRVSPELFTVLRRAQRVSRESGGTFDVTVGPLVALWRQVRKTAVLPAPAEIERARRLVGWQKIRLDARTRSVRLTIRGMKLDLGGIGKGYADDEAQRVLKQHGIVRALVEMGGDIVVSGPPPGTDGWTIRVPNAGNDQGPTDLHLANQALSTSGDTEQFVVIGGHRYSHIVDPRTGQALTNRVQVSLIAPDGLTSDPLTKAMSILGEQARNKLLRAYPGVKVYLRVLPSPSFGPHPRPLPQEQGRGDCSEKLFRP